MIHRLNGGPATAQQKSSRGGRPKQIPQTRWPARVRRRAAPVNFALPALVAEGPGIGPSAGAAIAGLLSSRPAGAGDVLFEVISHPSES